MQHLSVTQALGISPELRIKSETRLFVNDGRRMQKI